MLRHIQNAECKQHPEIVNSYFQSKIHQVSMNTNDLFQRNSGGQSTSANISNFASKQKSLFDHLEQAEKECGKNVSQEETTMEVVTNARDMHRRTRKETKHLRGQESLFKRPEAPITKCLPLRKLPGFMKNPQKWTKYTLSDVKAEEMSERGNKAAALSFLRELNDRRQAEEEEEMEQQPEKITFKKGIKFHSDAMVKIPTEDGKSAFESTKVVMPEYVVGQKKSRALKKPRPESSKESSHSTSGIKLNHLLEHEDDGE